VIEDSEEGDCSAPVRVAGGKISSGIEALNSLFIAINSQIC